MKLLRFTGSWCQPCKILENNLKMVQIEIPVEVYDVDHYKEIAAERNVRMVPTLILVDGLGRELKRQSGVLGPIALQKWLENER